MQGSIRPYQAQVRHHEMAHSGALRPAHHGRRLLERAAKAMERDGGVYLVAAAEAEAQERYVQHILIEG
jgi:hypothetical protein